MPVRQQPGGRRPQRPQRDRTQQRRRTGRPADPDGQVVPLALWRDRIRHRHPGPRRRRLHPRIPGGAVLPRQPPEPDPRRHPRHPVPRPARAQAVDERRRSAQATAQADPGQLPAGQRIPIAGRPASATGATAGAPVGGHPGPAGRPDGRQGQPGPGQLGAVPQRLRPYGDRLALAGAGDSRRRRPGTTQ
ncbi:hypothetical protein D3C80_1493510 [compost metagenome]